MKFIINAAKAGAVTTTLCSGGGSDVAGNCVCDLCVCRCLACCKELLWNWLSSFS